MVVCANAGGGNLTGTARGLRKAGSKAKIIAASVDLKGKGQLGLDVLACAGVLGLLGDNDLVLIQLRPRSSPPPWT